VDDDAARQIRRRPAVAEVLACRGWKGRNLRSVCFFEDLRHLLRGVRPPGAEHGARVRLAPEPRVRIPIQRDVFVAREDPGRTHSLLEPFQSGVPLSLTNTWGNGHLLLPTTFYPRVEPQRSQAHKDFPSQMTAHSWLSRADRSILVTISGQPVIECAIAPGLSTRCSPRNTTRRPWSHAKRSRQKIGP